MREDSWSPQESILRLGLVRAGLPEPDLNIDVFEENGSFLACLDLAYPRYRVGVEYYGIQHSDSYAEDVERMARLRANGWEMIEVTRAIAGRPWIVAARVRDALSDRGWRPGAPARGQ